MNKNLIKGLLIFAAGVGIGYFIGLNKKDKFLEVVEPEPKTEEKEEVKPEIEHEVILEDPKYIEKEEFDKIIKEEEYVKEYKPERLKRPKGKPAEKYSKKHIDYDPEDELYPDEEEEEDIPRDEMRVFEIDYTEFAEENNFFDKKTVLYFEEDDMLIYQDSDEQILNDEYVLGSDWRDSLENKGTIYIRNEKCSMDIELIGSSGSYEAYVNK